MKNTPLKQDEGGPQSVFTGDVIYYNHPDHGALSGSVISVGQHGCQVDGEHGVHPVKWESLLGHKVRSERKFTLVESGEDGSIALDENGKRVFIAGQLPSDDEHDEREDQEDNLAKSHLPVEMVGNPLRDQVVIDATLISAGYVPSLEYIHRTYGDHWSLPNAPVPAPAFDPSELVKAIAEVKASVDSSIKDVRTELAFVAALTSPKVMG